MPAEYKIGYGVRKKVWMKGGSNKEKDEDLHLPALVCHVHRITILFLGYLSS